MSGPGPHPADSTENWDDDFEFQPARSSSHPATSNAPMSLLQDKKNTLRSWGQPGPSTPPKRAHPDAENWDDDFQDSADSPLRPYAHDPASPSRRRRRAVPETENWDDDFEDDKHASPSKTARWDSSSDEDGDLGFAEREEDKTVTSRSRRSALSPANDSPPPPVPPIPALFHTDAQPFPRSPTASVFSVPLSGRDSVAGHSYSSTAHLALRPTQSGGSSGALPPSPPTHHARERRRLRKKSRPARVDDNIYELDDRLERPVRPVTPERSTSPPVRYDPDEPVPGATPASTGKSSLVSRIGSVGKKWGAARKKRASTGPAEVTLQEGKQLAPPPSRPMSVAIPSSSSKGWFFRHGGDPGAGSDSPPSNVSALPLKHEKSVDRLLSLVGLDYDTPSKRKQKIRQGLPPDLTSHRDSIAIDASPRKPRVPSSSGSSSRPPGSRNASYGGRHTSSSRGSSVPRSASASVDDVTSRRVSRAPSSSRDEEMRTPRKSRSSLDPEGAGRGLMGGMRRISLTGKHKRSRTSIHASERDEPSRPSTSTTSTAATAVPHLPPDDGTDVTPRPPSRVMPRLSSDVPLLPPIELQPPSPPREPVVLAQSFSGPTTSPAGFDTIFESATTSSLPSSHSGTMTAMQRSAMLPSSRSTLTKMPASPPQSASLGRAAHLPNEKEVEGEAVPRRSSLGDLKIPARISQAQVGLRRDLGMVREFANSVEKLRDLQTSYYDLVADVQTLIVETMPAEEAPSRALSPTLFGLPLPGYRVRSHTNPQSSKSASARQAAEHRELSAAYNAVEVKYQLSWECAELLVELGGGTPAQPPSVMSSFHADHTAIADGRKSRERAITLAGDEAKPQISNIVTTPTSASVPAGSASQWRASTGRHDLSHRQLILLRDMLQHPDYAPGSADGHLPEDANRVWRWGDAMSSTMTLPSEYSSSQHGSMSVSGDQLTSHKRRGGRLGMRALRDMLRSLKKSHSVGLSPAAAPQPIPPSSMSVAFSTMSSLNLPKAPDPSASGQRPRARTSVGPESVKSLREHPNSPYVTPASLSHKVSPRRPSLASLFKLGQKSKSSTAKSSPSSGPGCELSIDDLHADSSSSCQATQEDEDWDQLESASDLEVIGSATIRRRKGQSLYIPHNVRHPPPSSTHSSRYENSSQVSVASMDLPSTPSRARSQVPPLPAEPGSTRSHTRPTKLSDVRELAELDGDAPRPMAHRSLSKSKRQSYAGPGATVKRPSSRNGKTSRATGSLRNPPPGMWPGSPPPPEQGPGSMFAALAEGALALAMTPENIRPLLENAREVHARCADCLDELRQLLAAYSRPAGAAA